MWEAARNVLPQLNGVARLASRSYRNVEADAVLERGADGRKHYSIFAEATLEARSKLRTAAVVNGEEPTSEQPGSTRTDRWLELAGQGGDVAEALSLWGDKPHDWFNLYKVYEIIEHRANVVRSGFANRGEIRHFKRTANDPSVGADARHARLRVGPRPRPMTLSEADAFIERILRKWIEASSWHPRA